MKQFDKRLRRLEVRACLKGTCPGCGFPFVRDEDRQWKVVFGGEPDDPTSKTTPFKPPPKPPCKVCNRIDGQDIVQVVYELRFDSEG